MTRAEKMAQKKQDKQIEQVYYANCSGIQINMMDIPRVFDVGRRAIASGVDLKQAIVAFVDSIRKN